MNRASSKFTVIFLVIAATTALPTNNGYTYTEGVSGSLDTSASVGVNYVQPSVNYVQPAVNYVQQPSVNYVQTQTKYVQPQTSYVQTQSSNYVQPQLATVTTGSNYVQPQVATVTTNYVQPQVSTVTTGSRYVQTGSQVVNESPSVLISASSVGVPYVKSNENQYVEQNLNEE
uniref:Uncharacterized protein n=1 Tax=Megaselia scalaris TaxID=36166 RepID=T1GSI5_MEGSC